MALATAAAAKKEVVEPTKNLKGYICVLSAHSGTGAPLVQIRHEDTSEKAYNQFAFNAGPRKAFGLFGYGKFGTAIGGVIEALRSAPENIDSKMTAEELDRQLAEWWKVTQRELNEMMLGQK